MDSRAIEEQAAAWLVRRNREEWSEADAALLAAWLDASHANRVAFLRLEVGWELSERLAALGAGTPTGQVPPRGEWRVSPLFEQQRATHDSSKNRRRTPALVALAASLVVAAAVGAYLVLFAGGKGYSTPVGGTASIPLHDGSTITLNTETRIRVSVSDQERRVELARGEAFFEVAKDASRPFVVIAGDKRVVAVGTRFSVRRDDDDIRVVVTEGKVRVESGGVSSSLEPADRTEAAPLLVAGAIARTSSTAVLVETKSIERAEEALSWRSGYLTFDETVLADAVAEFNRYSTRKIYIQDPNVAALRINGKFRATNAAAFIRVLHEGFGIEAQDSDGRVVLSAR